MNTLRVHIRWMIRRDMPEVLAIERESFDDPWTEDDFVRCLRQRNYIGMVAEHEDRVVGSMIYELQKSLLHVLNFAVADDYRHRSIGRQMIAKLMGKLSPRHRTRLVFDVRESNLAAQQFLRACGFRAVAIVRERFINNENAYRMQFRYTSEGKDNNWRSARGDAQAAVH